MNTHTIEDMAFRQGEAVSFMVQKSLVIWIRAFVRSLNGLFILNAQGGKRNCAKRSCNKNFQVLGVGGEYFQQARIHTNVVAHSLTICDAYSANRKE